VWRGALDHGKPNAAPYGLLFAVAFVLWLLLAPR
jgi:hypothetical protein